MKTPTWREWIIDLKFNIPSFRRPSTANISSCIWFSAGFGASKTRALARQLIADVAINGLSKAWDSATGHQILHLPNQCLKGNAR